MNQQAGGLKGGAMLLLLVLTFLNLFNWADRYLIVAFSNQIVSELHLTGLQYGLLTGIVFMGIYTFFGLFAGWLADRMHRPRLIAAGLFLWSALTAATGLARSFGQMAAARLFVGVGEACLTPSALSLLSDRFPAERRAFAAGFYSIAFPLGIGASFIFAGQVGATLGWRGGFMLLGALGVAAAALVALFLRDPLRATPRRADANQSFGNMVRDMAAALRGNRALVLTLVGSGLAVFSGGAGILDILWWVRERGYPVAEAATTSGNLFLLGGAIGAVLGGAAGDWAHRRWQGGRLKFLAVALAVSAPLGIVYRLIPSHTPLFLFLAFYASIVALLMFGPTLSAVQDLSPPQHRGAGIALFILVTGLFGASGGNATAGWLLDVFTREGFAQPLTAALLTMQIPAVISIPVFWLAAREWAKRQEEAGTETEGVLAERAL
jgi:MFS family permease